MTKRDLSPFAASVGFEMVEDTAERTVATLVVSEHHMNRNRVMHGGAVMGFADQMGGTLAMANLRPGQNTTTIESKTNFFTSAALGDVLTAECTPLHRGRSTIVMQIRITRADGKPISLTTQTQMVLDPRPKAS